MNCWSCGCELELPPDFDPEYDGEVECDNCHETCVVIGDRTISQDEEYEAQCDSQASQRYEEAAYGRPDGDDQ